MMQLLLQVVLFTVRCQSLAGLIKDGRQACNLIFNTTLTMQPEF